MIRQKKNCEKIALETMARLKKVFQILGSGPRGVASAAIEFIGVGQNPGLRAIAILPVILYHFEIPLFTGGYVGVGIFFVISDFLITSLIHTEMLEGRFSILTFYKRRGRRIFRSRCWR